MSDQVKEPPLGLKPRWLWIDLRISEIVNAMYRYNKENKKIPKEWVDELTDHLNWIKLCKHDN